MNVIDAKRAGSAADGRSSDGADDVWVRSACSLCYATCSIRAHRVDGVITKLEGDPDSVVGLGRLCGKGIAGIMTHYDPHRVTKPMRRTNPQKGLDVDPEWEEISWEEALTEVAARLKAVRDDDPRKLFVQRTTTGISAHCPFGPFTAGFGTPNSGAGGGGLHCGNGAHLISGIMHASWSILPDFQYCNYAMYFGASKGHSAGHVSNSNMKMAADARARGMKMVVIDPFCNFAAAKATEWVPLRVGTDAALALAMANVMVNDLGLFDASYVKAKTNGAYLIGPDKRYLRDGETDKPLVWDESAGKAVPFDGTEADNMALGGTYQVMGVACQPAFALLAAHLGTYTPELGEEISTIPAADIRRLAEEFATEARIGSTIMIDGVEVPYRPAAAIAFRGNQGHVNSTYNMLAVDLLNQLVGGADMVGGCLGFNPACHGYPETGRLRYVPNPDPDGIMITGTWMSPHFPFPIDEPNEVTRTGLQNLFPMGMGSMFYNSADQEELWSKFDLPYRPEMMVNVGTNLVMSIGNKETVAEALKKYKFIVSFDLFVNESTQFSDIVLPDCDYLQSLGARAAYPFIFGLPGGMGDWCWSIRQPVAEPVDEQRRVADVLIELADRAGFLADMNAAFNGSLGLQDDHRLDPKQRYSYAEITDRDLKDKFGPDKGLDWFSEEGCLRWPKKPEEVYWRHFVDVRVPIYWEWMTPTYEKLCKIADPKGFKIPAEHYSPLPDWLPCPSHICDKPEFDLWSFYYRDILHTNSFTMENAWLDEAAEMDPFSYNVALNARVGRAKGLKTGDRVRIENEYGRSVEGKLRLTEAIHPEGLGIAALAGHWAEGLPRAKGKGVFYNQLIELEWGHCSPSNLSLDLCAKVKLTKIDEGERTR